MSGSLAAQGSASADAKGSAGLQFRHETAQEQASSRSAKVTTIRSGAGDIRRSADNRILDVGTAIDAAGDFSQQAATIDSRAASNTESSSSRTQSDAGKLGAYGKANAEASGNLQLSGGAGAGYTGNTLDRKKQSETNLDANAGAGAEIEYVHKDASKSASSSTAVVSTIKADGGLASTSTDGSTLEGTQMSGRNVELQAGSLDIQAARSTARSSEQETEGKGKLNAGVSAGTGSPVTGGLSGSFDRSTKSGESSDAVVGSIKAGDSVAIRTRDDARLEGTHIEAGGNASRDVGGKLDIAAAKNTRSGSEESIPGALEASATKSASGSRKGLALEGSYAKKSNEESKSAVGGISAGGDLALSTGGDARLEGAQIKARGNADVDVAGNLKFDAARDTSRSESLNVEGSVNLGKASVRDEDKKEQTDTGMFGMNAAGQYDRSADDKAATGTIGAGRNLRLRAGGDAALEGTDLRAGNQASVAAERDLDLRAASDFSESTKFSGELAIGGMNNVTSALGKDPKATPGEKADTRSAGLELSGDHAISETRRGGTVQAGAGGAQLMAGRDLGMEGGSIKSGGDAALTAGGDINLKTAASTASSIGGSLQAGHESERNTAKPDKDSSESRLGASLRGGVSESHEGMAINSGGQLRLESGGQTSMSNTGINAARGAVTDAAGGVRTATVKDPKEILNLGASKKSETGGTSVAPAPQAPWKAATPARDGGAAAPADAAKVKAPAPVIGGARKQTVAKKDAKAVKPAKPVTAQARKKVAAPSP
ncbi:MAG: hemagglutinin repeat-containing protein [Noviherbaspirillum sp.]